MFINKIWDKFTEFFEIFFEISLRSKGEFKLRLSYPKLQKKKNVNPGQSHLTNPQRAYGDRNL